MKRLFYSCALLFFIVLTSLSLYGQKTSFHAKQGMVVPAKNYISFASLKTNTTTEAVTASTGFENHPEIGMLFAEAPCDNCYELIGKRTEISKTFVKEGTNGHDIMQQSSSASMHYRDAGGNWRTIITKLQPDNNIKGIYAAYEQPVPVSINTVNKFSSIGNAGEGFEFNHNLELIYATPGGSEISLGIADWTNYTAGDDGVYVTNAWPGVDIEMYVIRGAVKTNFHINKAMPDYADGKLLVRDHLQLDKGLSLYAEGGNKYSGNLAIKNSAGDDKYVISAATAYEKNNSKNTFQLLDYYIDGNTLDIALPGNYLNRAASSYPVIIDPLVSIATAIPVTGSTYSIDWTVGCVYTNPATVPANVTVTDIQFAFTYITGGLALLDNGASDFNLAGCRSPAGPTGFGGLYWFCNFAAPGTCASTGGAAYSIFADLSSCVPPPSCPSYDLDINMNFYQDFGPTAPCATTYISASTPLIITVFGHTVEIDPVTRTGGGPVICAGGSRTLSTSAAYGVPPYTYSWMPGGMTGTSVVVSPTVTTTYTATVTDACGVTSSATSTVTVNPISPIAGPTTVCIGATATLTDAIPGGTWSSGSLAIATIGLTTGIVHGVAPGTSVITYTTPGGCTASVTVTVVPTPTAITGPVSLCQGTIITLADGTAGGTWSSSSSGVATIDSTIGVVTGISPGTTLITYSIGAACATSVTITVNPVPKIINGPATVCSGATIILTDSIAGGTWSSATLGVATVGLTTGVVTGVSGGTSTITYSTGPGCYVTMLITVIASPSVITGPSSVCQGSAITLSDAVAGGTWGSSAPTVATIGLATGVVTALTPGTTVITYTTGGGCFVTKIITVNPNPSVITGPSVLCSGTTIILADSIAGGTWSSGTPGVATVVAGSGIVTGVSGGTSTITYTTAGGCYVTYVITVIPSPSVITGPSSVCQGSTITLTNSVGGGTWSSSVPAIATVGLVTGIVTGLAPGTTIIIYTIGGLCSVAKPITVNPVPAPIIGLVTVCTGDTITLADPVAGGTWRSGTPGSGIATVGLTTGVVGGVTGGTSTITYTLPGGCYVTIDITIVASPSPITGPTSVCQGSTITLSNSVAGGVWASSVPPVATIGSLTGVVTGITPGTSLITYTTGLVCFVTTIITVNPLPAPITGPLAVCAGSTVTLSSATTGGTWSSGSPGIATIGLLTGVVTGVASGTATITYKNSSGCFVTAIVTVDPVPGTIAGPLVVCVGENITLTDPVAGGTWSSSNIAVATVNIATGVITGLSAGTSVITYATGPACWATATVTVNPLPNVTGIIFTNPTTCGGSDGAINLGGLTPGGTYTVSYTSGTVVTTTIIANASGHIIIFGLAAGTYSSIEVTSVLGCTATIAGPFILTDPPAPDAPLAVNNSPICAGGAINLSATDATAGVTYSWSGPGGFTSSLQDPVLSHAPITAAGAYTVVATLAGCTSAPGTTVVVVNPVPDITGVSSTAPTTCYGSDGTIILQGLSAGVSYTVSYKFNNITSNATITADASGNVTITGLSSGIYSDIFVSSFTCISNGAGPVTLLDPGVPPLPVLGSNLPLCVGQTLNLYATDIVQDGAYLWAGPDGYTSTLQNPVIPDAYASAIGTYTVTFTVNDCSSSDTEEINLYPRVILTNITPNQVIKYGSSIQLNADGAASYMWTPDNGTLNNNNINDPVATPSDSTTYTVYGSNEFDCVDSARVTIMVDNDQAPIIPGAFTPNGDGLNDVFRIGNMRYKELVEFSVYNRWGQRVYFNSYDPKQGWDGKFNGVPQDIGVYNYLIEVVNSDGQKKVYTGDVTLIR